MSSIETLNPEGTVVRHKDIIFVKAADETLMMNQETDSYHRLDTIGVMTG